MEDEHPVAPSRGSLNAAPGWGHDIEVAGAFNALGGHVSIKRNRRPARGTDGVEFSFRCSRVDGQVTDEDVSSLDLCRDQGKTASEATTQAGRLGQLRVLFMPTSSSTLAHTVD